MNELFTKSIRENNTPHSSVGNVIPEDAVWRLIKDKQYRTWVLKRPMV